MRRKLRVLAALFAVLGIWALTLLAPVSEEQSAVAEALIRHELASPESYLAQNLGYQPPFYLYLVEHDQPVDPPADLLRRLSTARAAFLPGSGWTEGHGTRIGILAPSPLGFSLYRVRHSYYCGPLCASQNIAVMFYDGRRWHVATSFMTSIS